MNSVNTRAADFVQGVASQSHDLRESDCRGLVLSCERFM